MTFLFGRFVKAVVQPGNLLLLCLLAGVISFLLSRGRRGRRLVGLSALGFLLLAVAPIGPAMLLSLEQRLPRPAALPERIDGILVLGGAIDSSAARVLGGIALARRHPEAKLALIGPEGGFVPVGLPELRPTLGFVVQQGIAPERVILEERSRSTHENAAYAKDLIRPEPGATWILITSAYHMPRSIASFDAVGWPVIPYPVHYRIDPRTGLRPNFSLLDGLYAAALASKEWAALVGYRLMGWTGEFFPAPSAVVR